MVVISKDYTEMHGQQNIKIRTVKSTNCILILCFRAS
jgi:hypothetical protein